MTDKQIKKYCEGLCTICDEKESGIYNEEPCIYKIANELEEKLKAKEQQIENLNKLTEQQNKDNINLTTKLGERILKNGELYNKLKAKEQECEELKEQLTDFMNGEYCANGCKKMQTQYKEYHCKLIKQLDQLKASKEQAEQKLNKIKDKCNETLELMNKASGTNAYAGGRCIEAEQILQIIDEVE